MDHMSASAEQPHRCALCQQSLWQSDKRSTVIATDPCGHLFHQACYHRSKQEDKKSETRLDGQCPTCRLSVTKTLRLNPSTASTTAAARVSLPNQRREETTQQRQPQKKRRHSDIPRFITVPAEHRLPDAAATNANHQPPTTTTTTTPRTVSAFAKRRRLSPSIANSENNNKNETQQRLRHEKDPGAERAGRLTKPHGRETSPKNRLFGSDSDAIRREYVGVALVDVNTLSSQTKPRSVSNDNDDKSQTAVDEKGSSENAATTTTTTVTLDHASQRKRSRRRSGRRTSSTTHDPRDFAMEAKSMLESLSEH